MLKFLNRFLFVFVGFVCCFWCGRALKLGDIVVSRRNGKFFHVGCLDKLVVDV